MYGVIGMAVYDVSRVHDLMDLQKLPKWHISRPYINKVWIKTARMDKNQCLCYMYGCQRMHSEYNITPRFDRVSFCPESLHLGVSYSNQQTQNPSQAPTDSRNTDSLN